MIELKKLCDVDIFNFELGISYKNMYLNSYNNSNGTNKEFPIKWLLYNIIYIDIEFFLFYLTHHITILFL